MRPDLIRLLVDTDSKGILVREDKQGAGYEDGRQSWIIHFTRCV